MDFIRMLLGITAILSGVVGISSVLGFDLGFEFESQKIAAKRNAIIGISICLVCLVLLFFVVKLE